MERTSYRKLYTKAYDLLKSSGIKNVEYDIKAILTDTFGLDLNKFILDMDNEFEPDKDLEAKYLLRIEKRKMHIPLQYICKYFIATQAHPEFRSRPFRPHPLFYGLIRTVIETK